MHSTAKRAFLQALISGPLDRPTGFAGGQPGWDHNAAAFVALGVVSLYRGDGRVVATLTAKGEEYARVELATAERKKRDGRGRPPVQTITWGDMTEAQREFVRRRDRVK